jgi:hypothetical protein
MIIPHWIRTSNPPPATQRDRLARRLNHAKATQIARTKKMRVTLPRVAIVR